MHSHPAIEQSLRWWLTAFEIASIISFVFFWYMHRKLDYWPNRGVFVPQYNSVFGNFENYFFPRTKSPMEILEDIYDAEGPRHSVIGFYVFWKPFLLIRDPELCRRILIDDFSAFSDRAFARNQGGDLSTVKNLFVSQSPEWKFWRNKLAPIFGPSKQKLIFSMILESAENMEKFLASSIKNHKVNLLADKLASKFVVDILSAMAFGLKTNSFVEPEPEFFQKVQSLTKRSNFEEFKRFLSYFFPRIAGLLKERLLKKETNYFRDLFWKSVGARIKSGKRRGDLIDVLLELKHSKEKDEIFGDHLLGQSAIVLLAGNTTCTTIISYALLELCHNRDVQDRLRMEIRNKIPKNGLTLDSVAEFTYLRQVVSETLRLHPPIPIIDRIALQDYQIPGTSIKIEKDTGIFINLSSLHKNGAYHRDPLKFDPDRFSVDRKEEMTAFSYLPFGDGPRICIGARTGILIVMVALITILKKYKVIINRDAKYDVNKASMFLVPGDEGIKLYFEKIS